MHMAVFGASRRIIGLSSPVATTATVRARSCRQHVLDELAHLAPALADRAR